MQPLIGLLNWGIQMPRGRPRKVIEEPDATLKGLEAVEQGIAEILQERCGIKGCLPKLHLDEARIILKKLVQYDLVKG